MHTIPKLRKSAGLLAGALLALASVARVPAAPFPPLNATPTGSQIPGKLVWADLFTSNADQATQFYTGLFGWTAAKIDQKGGLYTIFYNQGQPVAGLAPHSAGKENLTSHWIGYVSVTDLKAAVALAERNGGVVRGKIRRFPDRGYQAIIADAEGVPLGLLQSSSGDPADEDTSMGGWNWFEIYARDPKNASAFFHTVLGYSAEPEAHSDRGSEFVLSSGNSNRGGIAPLPEGADVHASWLGVIRVADIDETLAKVAGLGGQVLVAPHAVEYGSRFAIVGDPTGGSIGLVQYADNSNPSSSP
jgi:predicted enzyme related to lactoylglutathione lyase